MTPTRTFLRAIAVVLLLGLVGAACTSGDADDLEQLKEEVGGEEDADRAEQTPPPQIDPPPPADASLTGRVGIVIQANSPRWQELVGAPSGDGVVVIFVRPGGPAEAAGLQAGDLITAADGQALTNAERAVVVLRSQPGQERALSVTKPDGAQVEVRVQAEEPGDINQVQEYEESLNARPDDPVLHYLLAQERPLGQFAEAMQDAQRAIELHEEFVEAIEVRADRGWTTARQLEISGEASDEEQEEARMRREEVRDQAMSDWDLALRLDPTNILALVHRSQAFAQQGEGEAAEEDARKARSVDRTTPEAHFALGLSHLAQGQDTPGLTSARRAVELNPFHVEYYQLLARLFMRLDRPDDARATIDAIAGLIDDPEQRDKLYESIEEN